MTISLESVLVTGAASGIGRGVAKALAEQSVMALCLDADREKLDETVAQIRNAGGLAEAYVADITDEQSLAAMFAKIATLDR